MHGGLTAGLVMAACTVASGGPAGAAAAALTKHCDPLLNLRMHGCPAHSCNMACRGWYNANLAGNMFDCTAVLSVSAVCSAGESQVARLLQVAAVLGNPTGKDRTPHTWNTGLPISALDVLCKLPAAKVRCFAWCMVQCLPGHTTCAGARLLGVIAASDVPPIAFRELQYCSLKLAENSHITCASS